MKPNEFAASYLRVQALLIETGDAQWQAGKTPQPREDTTERAKGQTSDPTPTIVADGRRLKLRIAVLEAEDALAKATQNLRAAEAHLTKALTDWQG